MTKMTQKTTRVTEAIGNLIDEFKGQVNIEALIEAVATQSQELENAGFEVIEDTLIATSVGIQLDNIGTVVGAERGGRTDDAYRVRIGAQILLNKASGTIEELLAILIALGAPTGSITLTQHFPKKIEIEVDDAMTDGEEVGNTTKNAVEAATGYGFTWHESTNPFRFGVAGQGFNQGEFGGHVD